MADDIEARKIALQEKRVEAQREETVRKLASQSAASSALSAFFGAGLLWLIFGSVFLGIFVKLTQTIPFALVIGLVFVAILVWRGTSR